MTNSQSVPAFLATILLVGSMACFTPPQLESDFYPVVATFQSDPTKPSRVSKFVTPIVEEIPVIKGVPTGTAGFLGPTERGPESPMLVTSLSEYLDWFGTTAPDGFYLADAVRGFFANGGSRGYVARIAASGAVAATRDLGSLRFRAIGRGAWGNHVLIRIADGAGGSPDTFEVAVVYYRELPDMDTFVDPLDPAESANPNRKEPNAVELYQDVTLAEGGPKNIVAIVNEKSKLVRCWWNGSPARPTNQSFAPLEGGSDGAGDLVAADFAGSLEPTIVVPADQEPTLNLPDGRGLLALAQIDEVSLLVAPDETRPGLEGLTAMVVEQCEELRDRFALVTAPSGVTDFENLSPSFDSAFSALYFPWVQVLDPSTGVGRLVPPTGHVAGVFARTDAERGVHKAPAGVTAGRVTGVVGLEFPVTDDMINVLVPHHVNPLRHAQNHGIVVWGARTTSSDPDWKYVNVRRLLLFLEESIEEGTQWVVFEPNDERTWARVRLTITNFLTDLWQKGAFTGATPEEGFFVRCDRTTMTEDDLANHRIVCSIGVAPVKPAEFVVIGIFQPAAGSGGMTVGRARWISPPAHQCSRPWHPRARGAPKSGRTNEQTLLVWRSFGAVFIDFIRSRTRTPVICVGFTSQR